jgi:hypothetical protein
MWTAPAAGCTRCCARAGSCWSRRHR